MSLIISRYCYSPMGTFGILSIPNEKNADKPFRWLTVERPWLNNQTSISCIPEGTYGIGLRQSSVVSRTSRGEFKAGYEIKDVPDRTFIMMHIANTMNDLEGCVGLGLAQGFVKGKWAVTSSKVAFRSFMNNMESQNNITDIRICFKHNAMVGYKSHI